MLELELSEMLDGLCRLFNEYDSRFSADLLMLLLLLLLELNGFLLKVS